MESVQGRKDDQEKLRMDLVPVEAIESLATILGYGAKKYAPYNWQKGIAFSRIYAAALRHLVLWWKGQTMDPESGHGHLDHALCNLAFLVWYSIHCPQVDDRPTTMKYVSGPLKLVEGGDNEE